MNMGDRRLLDVVAERLTLGRRIRILRHRTTRWFTPPVRQGATDILPPLPPLPLESATSKPRGDRTSR
ncbi:MAG: hypothetical protein B6D46_10175 [Polyangiaceae bacterium UTPRO1]|jgi:hypothetical protein|nr:MAG: hypothetical protein B6D46_10175 [Polyangiaceae bacterium UTPRO1]